MITVQEYKQIIADKMYNAWNWFNVPITELYHTLSVTKCNLIQLTDSDSQVEFLLTYSNHYESSANVIRIYNSDLDMEIILNVRAGMNRITFILSSQVLYSILI